MSQSDLNREVRFLGKGPNTGGGDDKIKWIGFKAVSMTGEEKEFWWWRNYDDATENLKAFCDEVLSKHLIEIQIGPAVNVDRSSQDTGRVHIFTGAKGGRPVYGIYVEAEHRPMFSFMLTLTGDFQ